MLIKCLGIFALSASAAAANCDVGEVFIPLEHDAPAVGHPKGEAANFLAELVNREFDGRACMTVVPESTTYSDATVVEGLASGQYQMAAPAMGNILRDELQLLIDIVTLERNRFDFELASIAQQQARQDGIEIVRLGEDERIEWVRAMQPTWFRHGGNIGFDQIAAVSYAAQTATSMIAR